MATQGESIRSMATEFAPLDYFREPSISLDGVRVFDWEGENSSKAPMTKWYRAAKKRVGKNPPGYVKIVTSLSNTFDDMLDAQAESEEKKITSKNFEPSTCTFTLGLDEEAVGPGYSITVTIFNIERDRCPTGDGFVCQMDLSTTAESDDTTAVKKAFDSLWLDVMKGVVRCEFPPFPEGCQGKPFRHIYQLNARLKSGSFATVCRGTHRKSGKKVAIKCVLRKDLPPSDDAAIYHEVAILSSVTHKYVVPLIDFFEEKECYYLVMELMSGGDLFDRIGKKKNYSERDARDLCRNMLSAMQVIHLNNIAHCDMKPKNLLLVSDDDDSFIKLADFGFAARVHSPKSLTKQCGTPFFVSPEILMRNPYDQASDMWSVGCIVYLLLGGNLPFMGRSQKELFRKIVVGQFDFPEDQGWSDVSEDAKNLVRGLLVTDPDKRLTAGQALRSKWIMQRGRTLEKNTLMFTSQRLKTFNARMKLRSAMIAVDWVSSMRKASWVSRSSRLLNAQREEEEKAKSEESGSTLTSHPMRLSSERSLAGPSIPENQTS